MFKSFIDWLRFLKPSNILLIKKIVDAIEAVVRLLEELFDNHNNKEDKK